MNARSMLHRSLYEFQLYLLKILVLFFMSKFGTMGFQLTFLHLGTLQPAAVAAAILDLSDDEEPEIVVIPPDNDANSDEEAVDDENLDVIYSMSECYVIYTEDICGSYEVHTSESQYVHKSLFRFAFFLIF